MTTERGGHRLVGEMEPLVDLLWMLAAGLLVLLVSAGLNNESWSRIANPFVLICLIGSLVLTCWRMLRAHGRYLFLPITGFLFSSAIYFGLGSLIFTFGSEAEIGTAKIIVDFTTFDITRVLILNQVAILLVVASYLAWSAAVGAGKEAWDRAIPSSRTQGGNDRHMLILMIGLGLWALAIKFFVALPFQLKLTDSPPSGLLVGTAAFSYGTEFYLWFRATTRGGKKLALMFTVLDFLIGVVSLSKVAILLPWLMAVLGSHAARTLRIRIWFLLATIATILLVVIQPVNNALRSQRLIANPSTLVQAISLFGDVANLQALEAFRELRRSTRDQDTFWLRLSYVNVEAFVIQHRDRGESGDSYRYFTTLFVPRWLWRDKPIVNAGHDFDRNWLGKDSSAVGITLFAEAFFNLGWMGIGLMALCLGGIFRAYELPARWVLKEGRFEQAITLFSGIFIGIRPDEYAIMVASTFLAAIPFAIAAMFLGRIYFGLFRNDVAEQSA